MGSGVPWKLIVKVNFTSVPAMLPLSNGSVPCGDLNMPESFSPSCLKVAGVVLAPCGEFTVMSQSPLMSGCANTGVARRSSARASSVDVRRVMQSAPEK